MSQPSPFDRRLLIPEGIVTPDDLFEEWRYVKPVRIGEGRDRHYETHFPPGFFFLSVEGEGTENVSLPRLAPGSDVLGVKPRQHVYNAAMTQMFDRGIGAFFLIRQWAPHEDKFLARADGKEMIASALLCHLSAEAVLAWCAKVTSSRGG
jgi:hypothetical protein